MPVSMSYPRAYVFGDDPGSAGAVDLSGQVLGDDYFVVRIETDITKVGHEVTNTEYGTGKGHFFKKKKWKPYEYKINGFIKETTFGSTVTVAQAPIQFISDNWGDRTGADYMVVAHDASTYELFADENGSNQNVARGFWGSDVTRILNREDGNFYTIRGTFTISWN